MRQLLFAIFPLFFCLASWSFQEARQNTFRIEGRAQGTTYQISYIHSQNIVVKNQIDSILDQIDHSMSLYKENSLISTVNRQPKRAKIDTHFINVMKKSFDINRDTDGLFDVTVEPLLSAWGFSSKKPDSLPTPGAIQSLLPSVGMDKIKIRKAYLIKESPDVQINVNGIAQGYTVDVLANFLRKNGITDFFIELGGEIKAEGRKADQTMFSIGVEGPLQSASGEVGIKHVVSLNNKAITTSGGYNQFVKKDDKIYIHIINPKTGYPIETDILSVTVLADDAITADGYDNAIMAMGMEKGMNFLKSRPYLDAYIVYKNSYGTVLDTMTNGFKMIIKTN